MGLRHWGQTVSKWNEVPMPMAAPTIHNPALVLDWNRFCSDTIVQFVKMQAELLREISPQCPVTTNLRPLLHRFDHFDLAEALDFVSIESTAAIKPKSSELACEIDLLRSLKKNNIRVPRRRTGVLGHGTEGRQRCLAGSQFPGAARACSGCSPTNWFPAGPTPSCSSGGASPGLERRSSMGRWSPTMPAPTGGCSRRFRSLGEEMKLLAPSLKGTRVQAETCILYSHDNEWVLAAAQPAEQVLQSARAYSALLQRAP